MLAGVVDLSLDVVPGRWLVRARLGDRAWEVIVEPIHDERILLVITAYPTSGRNR